MNEHRYPLQDPTRARRQQAAARKAALQQPAGRDRATQLAAMARAHHDARDINQAMDLAAQALADAGGSTDVVVGAYLRDHPGDRPDLVVEDLAMLAGLARWLAHDGLAADVRDRARDHGLSWCGAVGGRERERRLEVLRRRFDPDLADEVDVALA